MITDPPAILTNRPRLRGAKGKGITYEKHVGRALQKWQAKGELVADILIGPWFSFEDSNGRGYCQPDILLVTKDYVFILECKLTFTNWAWPQLQKLYKPVVERVFERPAITIQVCKHLHYVPGNMVDLVEILDSPRTGSLTWHFLGS